MNPIDFLNKSFSVNNYNSIQLSEFIATQKNYNLQITSPEFLLPG